MKGEVTLQWTAPVGGNQEWFDEDDMQTTCPLATGT